MRPRALDLFCGAGGVSVGLQRAGFAVVGVDIRPQPNFRGGEFVQADALEYPLEGFDFIWASPPCQAFSQASRIHDREHADLLTPTIERLERWGGVWAVENVPGAPMQPPGVTLCGLMFGLRVFRHRLIKTSWLALQPPHPSHAGKRIGEGYYCVAGHDSGNGGFAIRFGSHRAKDELRGRKGTADDWRRAMGIDWMTRDELSQAIPPAYAEFIGRQALAIIGAPA